MCRLWVGLILGVAAVLVAGTTALAQTVRVTATDASVRLSPDRRSPAIMTVKAGTLLELKATFDNWYGVLLTVTDRQPHQYGFIERELAELVNAGPVSSRDGTRPVTLAPPENFSPAEQTGAAPWRPDWNGDPETGAFISVILPYDRFRDSAVAGGYGVGFSIGRRSPRASVDLSYAQSSHGFTGARQIVQQGRQSQANFTGTALYRRLGVDTKRYWRTGTQIIPSLDVGFGVPWLTIKEGAIIEGVRANVSFIGIGFDIGGGVAVPVHPRVIVELGAVHRFDFFLGARTGSGSWFELEEVLIERGPRFTSGLALVF